MSQAPSTNRSQIDPSRLRYVRDHRGLTREALASLVGISVKSVQRFESGKVSPTPAVLDLIALHLGVSPDYLQGKVEGLTSSRVTGDLVVRHEGEGDGPSELAKTAENVAALGRSELAKTAERVAALGSQLGETMQEAAKAASTRWPMALSESVQAAMASSALSPRLMEFMSAVTPPPGREKLTPMELAEQILAQTPEEIEAVLLIVRVQMARMGLPWPGAK